MRKILFMCIGLSAITQAFGIITLANGKVSIKPGSADEKALIVAEKFNRIEGASRIIGNNGFIEYRFQCLNGAKVDVAINATGPGIIIITDGNKQVASIHVPKSSTAIKRSFTTEVSSSVRSPRIRIQCGKKDKVKLNSVAISWTDVDADKDGIGDGFERLSGEPASSVTRVPQTTPRLIFETSSAYARASDPGYTSILVNSFNAEDALSWKKAGFPISALAHYTTPESKLQTFITENRKNGVSSLFDYNTLGSSQPISSNTLSQADGLIAGNPIADLIQSRDGQYSDLCDLQDYKANIYRSSAETSATLIPYRGLLDSYPFAMSYMQKKIMLNPFKQIPLWIGLNFNHPDINLSSDDARRFIRQEIAAAAMMDSISGYLFADSSAITNKSSEASIEWMNGIKALEEMASDKISGTDFGSNDIAILYSDTLCRNERENNIHPYDFFGLCLPLIQRGVPIHFINIDCLTSLNQLKKFTTIIASFDVYEPMNAKSFSILADWTDKGGRLVVIGSGLPSSSDGKWKQTGMTSPTDALLSACGIETKLQRDIPQETLESDWILLMRGSSANSEARSVELPELSQAETFYISLGDSKMNHGLPIRLHSFSLAINGKSAIAFTPGNPIERQFLYRNSGSRVRSFVRSADNSHSWIYAVKGVQGKTMKLTLELSGDYEVKLSAKPPFSNRLLTPASKSLANQLQTVTLHGNEILSIAEKNDALTPLYSLNNTDVISSFQFNKGKGAVLFLGVSPRYFLETEEGDAMYRLFIKYAQATAQNRYRERARTLIKRGRYVVAFGNYRASRISGSFIDILDASMPVLNDPRVFPNQAVIYLDIAKIPVNTNGYIFTNGFLSAKLEKKTNAAYIITGPSGVGGSLLLQYSNIKSVNAYASNGVAIPVKTSKSGRFTLIQWQHRPDGVLISVNTQK